MNEYALIVAGGKGTRFGSQIPKQFLELAARPILMHSIEAFYEYSKAINVVVVLPEEDIAHWHSLTKKHNFSRPLEIVTGGATRFQSVKNGLERIPANALVAIHDGVRPLVTSDIIRESFRLAATKQSAIACVPLKESLRMVAGQSAETLTSHAVNRSNYRLVQTPQTFQASIIKKAYLTNENADLTDDASVAEQAGHSVTLFMGRYDNIKITHMEDLLFAEAVRSKRL